MSSQEFTSSLILVVFLSLNLCFGSRIGVKLYQETVSVEDFGAKASDGSDQNDDTEAFEKAWSATCSQGLTLVVPEGKTYYLKPITFSGPCQNSTTLKIYGRIRAWPDMSAYEEDRRHWIVFEGIENLNVEGGGIGTIDGTGQIWWQHSCKIDKTLPCKEAPTAVTFFECKKLRVKHLCFKDAQKMHISFQNCHDVKATHLKVTAPGRSPNTDGIHITETHKIHIDNTEIGTGDDCISIVSGSKRVTATNITCGPGHGISIGSLGEHNSENMVSNVMVDGAQLIGTTNGVRIKTWQGGSGYAKNIKFMNIKMLNVSNPIIVDQNYCDQEAACQQQDSAVAISNVSYKNIVGTSASKVAINFDCSKTVPCSAISLEDVDLKPEEGAPNGKTTASCVNVGIGDNTQVSPQC